MKNALLFLCICTVAPLITGCASEDENIIKTDTYEDSVYGFSIDIPDEWRAEIVTPENAMESTTVIKMLDPDNESSIIFSSIKRLTTAKEAATMEIESLRFDPYKKFTRLDRRPWSDGTHEGYLVTNLLIQEDQTLYQRRIYISVKPMLYIFILNAPQEEIADIYQPFFDQVVNSLKITKEYKESRW